MFGSGLVQLEDQTGSFLPDLLTLGEIVTDSVLVFSLIGGE
jgi:hypothetical protein